MPPIASRALGPDLTRPSIPHTHTRWLLYLAGLSPMLCACATYADGAYPCRLCPCMCVCCICRWRRCVYVCSELWERLLTKEQTVRDHPQSIFVFVRCESNPRSGKVTPKWCLHERNRGEPFLCHDCKCWQGLGVPGHCERQRATCYDLSYGLLVVCTHSHRPLDSQEMNGVGFLVMLRFSS